MMGSDKYAGVEGCMGKSLEELDIAVKGFVLNANKHEENLIQREVELDMREDSLRKFLEAKERSISEREKALLVREKLLEEKEKSIFERERGSDRDTRKADQLKKLCQQLNGTCTMLDEGKRQILEDKQQLRIQTEEAMLKIKTEAAKERQDIVDVVIKEIEAFRLPSANISFKNETAAVNKLVSEVKRVGSLCSDFGKNNNILTPEDFSRRRE